jgi:prevent-host-death family protein
VRKASIRDLHIRTSELVREAADGCVIVIERRGEPVAELRPIGTADKLTPAAKKRIFDRMRRIRASMPPMPDNTTRFIEEDRNG